MSGYSNLFNGSYLLSYSNMKDHLAQENEQKLNVIQFTHTENMQSLYNERNRNNNAHTENMQRLSNEREDKQNMRNNERRMNDKDIQKI